MTRLAPEKEGSTQILFPFHQLSRTFSNALQSAKSADWRRRREMNLDILQSLFPPSDQSLRFQVLFTFPKQRRPPESVLGCPIADEAFLPQQSA